MKNVLDKGYNSMDDIVMEIVQEKFVRKLKEAVDRKVKEKVKIATEACSKVGSVFPSKKAALSSPAVRYRL